MMKSSVALLLVVSAAACSSTPKTATERQTYEQRAETTLMEMEARDPTLRPLLDQAIAYVVFPSVGKGGVIVGGAFGRGILFENHQPSGFVELKQGSFGAQLGGATFSELVVLNDPYAVQQIKSGKFKFGANVSAVALTAGAGRAASFARNPNPVFTMARGGLMVDVSVTGQSLSYKPFIDEQAMR